LVIIVAMIGPVETAPLAEAKDKLSALGEFFTQWYPCTQPPAWIMQPGVRSDVRPAPGTGASPFARATLIG
jgi:hypothetical protein